MQLAEAYSDGLAAHDIVASQVLLTLGDTEQRNRYLNARATLKTLLDLKAIPVINENDTVATAEIRYGDNDRLAARVASMMGADLLVLLSDVDGLYTADPTRPRCHADPGPRDHPQIEALGDPSPVLTRRHGIKIAAARLRPPPVCVLIAKGKDDRAIYACATVAATPASRHHHAAQARKR